MTQTVSESPMNFQRSRGRHFHREISVRKTQIQGVPVEKDRIRVLVETEFGVRTVVRFQTQPAARDCAPVDPDIGVEELYAASVADCEKTASVRRIGCVRRKPRPSEL